MTREAFRKLAEANLIFLDGATGSNLMKMGMPSGVCPEQWIIEHPDTILKLQRDYAEAGSHIVYAPTFTGNRIKLTEYGLAERIGEINGQLVRLSRQAVAGKALVAGDISMTGRQLRPVGKMTLTELIAVYQEQITHLAKAGADLLVIETMMSLPEARAALIAAKETCDLPVMVSLTFETNGRTLFGTDGRTAAVVLESLGASAVGVNCSAGPDKMLPIIQAMAAVSTLPIIAKPNAGLPSLDKEGHTVYDMAEDVFVSHMKKLVSAGASILGGCCGTTPAYIAELVTGCADMRPIKREMTDTRYLTSERKTVSFGLDDPFIIIGERINPTGKKKMQEELRNGRLDKVIEFAESQEADGAAVLDINMGMSGIDEKAMMLRVLEEIGLASSLPVAIDSSYIEVIEAALRHYPGRALINSISYEKAKFEELLPIAAKYGAMFILLPLSDAGLPQDLAEKKEIIEKITARALALGMKKTDVIVDGLVTTVGANPTAALETLETIRYCREKGYATTCGLSNISFGLPERSYINTAFLTMAIREGLTMAIANPSPELLNSCALAADLLLNRKGADLRYIEKMNDYKEQREKAAAVAPVNRVAGSVGSSDSTAVPLTAAPTDCLATGATVPAATGSAVQLTVGQSVHLKADFENFDKGTECVKVGNLEKNCTCNVNEKHRNQTIVRKEGAESTNVSAVEATAESTNVSVTEEVALKGSIESLGLPVREAVLKGNRSDIEALTQTALAEGMEAKTLLDGFLLPAINQVGTLFDEGRYFLPQLIASAETMKLSIELLEPLLLQNNSSNPAATVVIATVAGDIHDIGKNLVVLMLKNYGYHVIDLGKDVDREVIVEQALAHKAEIIALSALMTTTMVEMKRVVELVRERAVPARVIIGGAVVTQEYADEIGADGYARDAADTVRVVQSLLNNKCN